MNYWFYENWVAEGHKARIHRSKCSFCNGGEGIHPGAGKHNGQWVGPFETVTCATEAAKRTDGRVSRCKFCCP